MTVARSASLPLCSLMLFFACSARDSAVPNLSAEADAIRALHEAWFAAEARRDIDASMAVLAPGIVFKPAGAPAVIGLEAARQLYEGFFALPYTSLTGEVTHIEVAAGGDLAYDLGTWNAMLTIPQGPQELRGKFMGVFKKADGQWKVVANSYSTDSP